MRGVDMRTVGSNNVGATNVFPTLGKGIGFAVMGADIGKGLVAGLVAQASNETPWPLENVILRRRGAPTFSHGQDPERSLVISFTNWGPTFTVHIGLRTRSRRTSRYALERKPAFLTATGQL